MTQRPHIVDGQFQSDKYPTCPPGKVPLSVEDPTAQDLLWEYAQRRRAVDAEFADDLEFALRSAGYKPRPFSPASHYQCNACGERMRSWQEMEEYQHADCGGLVEFAAVTAMRKERDDAIEARRVGLEALETYRRAGQRWVETQTRQQVELDALGEIIKSGEADYEALAKERDAAIERRDWWRVRAETMEAERDRLRALIGSPQTENFLEAVRVEAAHQVERWGNEHDAGKTDADWFWLIGYLAGKALGASRAEPLPRYRHVKRGTTYEVLSIGEDENRRGTNAVVYRGEDDGKIWVRPSEQFFDGRFEELQAKPPEKKLHHIITTAAACLNWHRHAAGENTSMRPGIAPPETP